MPFLIVGAGCFGLSTAMALLDHGVEPSEILVFDRSETLPAQDSASYDINKMVRSDYGDDLMYTQMAIDSMSIFRQWNDSSRLPLFHECGVLILTANEAIDSFEAKSRAHQCSTLELSETLHIGPLDIMKRSLPFGYFNSKGGWADSALTLQFMLDSIRYRGVQICGGVERIMEDGAVICSDGQIYSGTVIVACGAWSSKLLPELDPFIQARAQPIIHIRLEPESEAYRLFSSDCSCWMADIGRTGFYGFPLQTRTGQLKFANHGAGIIPPNCPSYRPDENLQDMPEYLLSKFKSFIATFFPSLKDARIEGTRFCWYTDTFDGDFIIDWVPGRSNVLVVTGGSGHGFKFTPIIGRIAVDVIFGKKLWPRFKWRPPMNGKREASRCL